MAFGDFIVELFTGFGTLGLLLALFFIFLIDGMIFPMLPEVFVVLFYIGGMEMANPPDPVYWGGLLIIIATVGATCGNALLYGIVKLIGLPKFLTRWMKRYTEILFVSDERLILVNRIAPVLPFVGAFIATLGWNVKKSLAYVAIGGFLKYCVIVVLAGTFVVLFETGTARLASLILVISVIIVSLVASRIQRRRLEARAKREGQAGKETGPDELVDN
jgi:membrane protein YqaA with SNARE-associated domain